MSREPSANEYSANWFEVFLPPSGTAAPEREIAFLHRWLPLPAYGRVLDLCCGVGRHAQAMADCGYGVTGLDRNLQALRRGASNGRGVRYLQGDMRSIPFSDGSFDAVVCLWQSFGYFDEAANRRVLCAMRRVLGPRGRLVLDVYRRGFFVTHEGCRQFTKDAHKVTEWKRMVGDRLHTELEYVGKTGSDKFDWQLFEPDELCEVAQQARFSPLVVCADFNSAKPSLQGNPRMQLVFAVT